MSYSYLKTVFPKYPIVNYNTVPFNSQLYSPPSNEPNIQITPQPTIQPTIQPATSTPPIPTTTSQPTTQGIIESSQILPPFYNTPNKKICGILSE